MPDLQPPKPSEEAIALWRKRRERDVKRSSKPQSLKQLAAALKKNADDNITRLEGTLLRTAGAGGKCLVRLLKQWKGLKELPATAIDGCTAHKRVVLFRGRDGDWFALGKGNEKLWTQREAARRGRYANPAAGSIQYVLQKNFGANTAFYICGGQAECIEVLRLPSSAPIVDLAIDNLGGDYLFSLCYQDVGGDYIFVTYNREGLIGRYSEAGIVPYLYNFGVGAGNFTTAASGFMVGTYGNKFFYAVGFGRFAANFCRDSNTLDTPLPIEQPGTATTTGNIRMLIDIPNSKYQKTALPTQSASRSTDGLYFTDDWLGIPVFSTLFSTSTSFLTGTLQLPNTPGGNTIANSNADMRYLLKASETGDIAISHTLKEVYNSTVPQEDYAVILAQKSGESHYLTHRFTDGTPTSSSNNRFLQLFSPLASISGKRFADVVQDGITAIERSAPNPAATPTPVPETTLYQLERSQDPRSVTVQILDFEFRNQASLEVNVFHPDINQGELTNFGTIVAASYAPTSN